MPDNLEKYIRQLEALDNAGRKARQTIERIRSEINANPTGTGFQNLQDELRVINQIAQKYLETIERINAAKQQTGMGATIPHPAGLDVEPKPGVRPGQGTGAFSGLDTIASEFQKSVLNAKTALAKLGKNFEKVGEFATEKGGIMSARLYEDLDTKGIKVFLDKFGNFGRSMSELSRAQILNNAQYDEMFKFAQQTYGFNREDFVRMRASGAGAYQEALFRQNRGGVNFEQAVNVGQGGEVRPGMTLPRFQSFTQRVGKDIGDLLKWSIAISAIYGPINALSEAMAQLVENQTKLADVSVALNSEVATTDDVFNASADAAKRAGETIGGVIDAFGQAYRAAGRISNQFERYQATVKLLDSSLVLSKISTLDQAQAIDVLTAALYQAAGTNDTATEAFNNATHILDQWVRVSKIANVDVATLATGVAVLGDSAEAAGLGIEQLNALIATIAEVSISGGKEAANIAKALVGNYQQPEAVKALNRLGIAVVDVTGKNREFLDVMKDVAALRSQGILQDQDFARLTLALGGGGIRRQADVARFIENFGRMEQIVKEQAGAGGESAEALAKKLETVQTSATNLGNSFTSLAQTLGTKGGLLDVFSNAIGLSTKLVEALNSVASVAGKTGPMLLGLGVGALLLRGKGGAAGISALLQSNLGLGAGLAGVLTGAANPIDQAQQALFNRQYGSVTGGLIGGPRPFAPSTALGRATTLPSLAAIALPAIQNISNKDYEEAGANIAGGITGALVAGPVGALIGSAIAEAFVRTTITYDVQFADFFAGTISNGLAKGGQSTDAKQSIDDLMSEAFKSVGFGNEDLGRIIAYLGAREARPGAGGQYEQYKTQASYVLAQLEKTNPELAAELRARFAQTGGTPSGVETRLTLRQKEITQQPGVSDYLKRLQQEEQDRLRTSLVSGEIKPSDYANRLASVSAFSVTATRYMAALEDQVGGVGDAFKTDEEAYKAFLDILSAGNQETIDNINSQIASIDYLQNIWENWNPSAKTAKVTVNGQDIEMSQEQLKTVIDNANAALSQSVYGASQQALLGKLRLPQAFGSQINPMQKQDVALLVSETLKNQKIAYQELPPEMYDALTDSFEKVAFLIEDGGKLVHQTFSKLDQKILNETYQQLVKEGKIAAESAGGVPFSETGATAAQIKAAEIQAPAFIEKYLAPKGYKSDVTDAIYSTKDEQIIKAHGDQKIIQYLLQQILDTEKKQLEGVYNLPEGATFWVPLTAAWLAQRPYGEGAGIGTEGQDLLKNPSVVGGGAGAGSLALAGALAGGAVGGLSGMEKLIAAATTNYLETQGRNQPATGSAYRYNKDELSQYYGTKLTTEQTGGVTTFANSLIQAGNSLKDILTLIPSIINKIIPGGEGGFKTGRIDTSARRELLQGTNNQTIQTRLDIKFSSTTQLLVDGRILASIVKPYLAGDLLKTNQSGGTITRQYVI